MTLRPTMDSASAASLQSAMGRVSTTWPARITVTALHRLITSRSLCVMRISVVPSSCSRRSVMKSWSVSCGVSTAVGSSRIRILAPR
ncbi:hypothetical protein DBR42_26870 [Pelomonas sp. HMWF004]|nr:hypothetical protein DBR42_26870 [Pelomonas sp. HMWF004]